MPLRIPRLMFIALFWDPMVRTDPGGHHGITSRSISLVRLFPIAQSESISLIRLILVTHSCWTQDQFKALGQPPAMAGSRVLSHMSELLQALSTVHVSFRVPPLVYSTRRDQSAETHPLPCVPSSHCATHSAGSVSPVRHTSRLQGSCTYLL